MNTDSYHAVIDSPIGDDGTRIGVYAANGRIQSLHLAADERACAPAANPILLRAVAQLQAYFEHRLRRFDLPLEIRGTPFQQRVWHYLRNIPWGTSRTYGQVAADLETSARAVGNACRRNPVPLLVPCHRVVSTVGDGGFLGASTGHLVDIKAWLLAHEQSG